LSDRPAVLELLLPHDRGELISQLHRQGRVVASAAEDGGMRVHAVVPPRILAKFTEFQVPPKSAPKRPVKRRPRAAAASRGS
jgi:hypothetical protein